MDALGREKESGALANAQREGGKDDEHQIRARTGERHERRPARIPLRPLRIVWRAGVPHRPTRGEGAHQRQDDHAERLALDVRARIEADLAAMIGGEVAPAQRGPGVRSLV